MTVRIRLAIAVRLITGFKSVSHNCRRPNASDDRTTGRPFGRRSRRRRYCHPVAVSAPSLRHFMITVTIIARPWGPGE
jgi:hypothetical protein